MKPTHVGFDYFYENDKYLKIVVKSAQTIASVKCGIPKIGGKLHKKKVDGLDIVFILIWPINVNFYTFKYTMQITNSQ